VTKTAIVGFSGALRGSCEVRMSSEAARSIASAMLGGTPIAEDDDSIGDALGEICNMLAGGWKNRIPTLACLCSLSPPTVISGCDYKVQMSTSSLAVSRHYAFDVHTLSVSLRCEEPAG
jgi:chemotaxis protein CheX